MDVESTDRTIYVLRPTSSYSVHPIVQGRSKNVAQCEGGIKQPAPFPQRDSNLEGTHRTIYHKTIFAIVNKLLEKSVRNCRLKAYIFSLKLFLKKSPLKP